MALPALAGLGRLFAGSSFLSGLSRHRLFNVKTSMKWYGKKVHRNIRKGMSTRVADAARMLRAEVRKNISVPVKYTGSGVIRSQPGQYPRMETRRLRRDIFWRKESEQSAIVGTTLDYGLVLETKMNRSFLRRTYREQIPVIRRILLSGKRLPGQQS